MAVRSYIRSKISVGCGVSNTSMLSNSKKTRPNIQGYSVFILNLSYWQNVTYNINFTAVNNYFEQRPGNEPIHLYL